MHYELFISFRYLRAKRREIFISLITTISTLGVLIGVMVLNVTLAIMTGFEEDLRSRILGFNPHILLSSLNGPLDAYEQVAEQVRQVPGIAAAAPFLYGQVMVSSPRGVSGVVVRGVEPALASAVVNIADHIKEGSLARLGQKQLVHLGNGTGQRSVELAGIVIGEELADQLGLLIGDPITLISPLGGTPGPLGMAPRLKRFVVVGLFDSGMVEYDSGLLYMALQDAQQFFKLDRQVSGLEIRLQEVYNAQPIARQIEELLGFPYKARDWTEINRNLFTALSLEKFVYSIVILLIVLVAAFNIVATLIMVVMEKRKDIALLKSMGASDAAIGRIFIYKGLVIGLVGTLLGTLSGFVLCWLLQRYEFIELPPDVWYVSTVPIKMSVHNFLIVGLASVAICLGATIYPARQAARLAPVEVIRYE